MDTYHWGYGYKIVHLPYDMDPIARYLDMSWPPMLREVAKMEDIPEKNMGFYLCPLYGLDATTGTYVNRIELQEKKIPSYLRRYEFKDGWLIVDDIGTIHDASDTVWLADPGACLSLFMTDIADAKKNELLSDPTFKANDDVIILDRDDGRLDIRIYTLRLDFCLDDIKHMTGSVGYHMYERGVLEANGYPGPIWDLKKHGERYAWMTDGEVILTLPKDDEAYWEDYFRRDTMNRMESILLE